MEWEPQFHLSSASAFRSVAALRHNDTSRIKTTLLSSQKTQLSVRQAKSETSKVTNSKGGEVRVRRSTCPVSNPDNLCASHLLFRNIHRTICRVLTSHSMYFVFQIGKASCLKPFHTGTRCSSFVNPNAPVARGSYLRMQMGTSVRTIGHVLY